MNWTAQSNITSAGAVAAVVEEEKQQQQNKQKKDKKAVTSSSSSSVVVPPLPPSAAPSSLPALSAFESESWKHLERIANVLFSFSRADPYVKGCMAHESVLQVGRQAVGR